MHEQQDSSKNKPTPKQVFITGLASAIADVLVTHPLWTMKTLQQQGMTNRQIFSNFSRNPFLAYNGVATNASAMIPITITRIFLSSQFESRLRQQNKQPSAGPLLFSSFLAGSISSTFGAPTELIRTIKLKQATLSAEKNQKFKGENFFHVSYDFVKKRGLRHLGNGMITIAMRDGSYTAAFFTGAPLLKEKMSHYIPNNIINSLFSYSVASIMASLSNHPFDTIKTLQHTAMATRYLSNSNEKTDFINICKQIIKKDGYYGFWKGYPPRGLRFLIGLIVKANCIEMLNRHWEEQNQLLHKKDGVTLRKSLKPG